MEPLEALRARVGDDLELARRLRSVDPEAFAVEAAALAAELGCEVTAAELAAAVARGRHAWTLRWIL